MKGVTWPINNSTMHTTTRRISRKSKGRCWSAFATPVIRLPFKIFWPESFATIRISFMTFVCDVITKVNLRCHFSISIFLVFLRFGKAGSVTKGNIFICARYFFPQVNCLSRIVTIEIRFSKSYSRYSLFFKLIWASVRFLLNVERDEFGLRRRKASPFANPVFTLKCMIWRVVRVLEGRCLFVI